MRDGPTIGDLGERGFLDVFRHRFAAHTRGLVLGSGDDVAITPESEPGRRYVWTVDTMVEDTHFRFWEGASPGTLAGKLAASNLSDLASKGARPLFALLSLGVPPQTPLTDLEAFYDGLDAALSQHGARLIGGDTVRSSKWVLTLTLAGDLDAVSTVAARDRARPGQFVYITGWPGESGAGLQILEANRTDWRERFTGLVGRHLSPTPRVEAGQALVKQFDDLAMIDVSDGVSIDGSRVAAASGVRLVLDEEQLPVSADLREFALATSRDPATCLLQGGEDYELLFATCANEAAVRAACGATPVHRIGHIEAGAGVSLRRLDGTERPLEHQGFEHFT